MSQDHTWFGAVASSSGFAYAGCQQFRTGYGPRMTAFIAELAGGQGDSRTMIQNVCSSVFNFPISLGAIQKVIDRASQAILPHYEAIGDQARKQEVNHVDESSWYLKGVLCWLWVLASASVAFFIRLST